MEQEIKDIIAKQLPAQVGDVLKTRLEQADRMEKELEDIRSMLQQSQIQRRDLETERNSLQKDLSAHAALSLREATVSKREQAMDVFEANLKAAEAEKRATELHGLVQTVFKSPVYRKNYFTGTYYDGQGRNLPTINGSEETIE